VIIQIIIGVTGVTAIWLSQNPDPRIHRWACVAGILGQPFWFIAMYQAEQWGILVLCVCYTISWMRGVRNYWWRKS